MKVAPKYQGNNNTITTITMAIEKDAPSSAKSVQYGRVMFLPVIMVDSAEPIRSCECTTPTGVAMGLSRPDAVIDTITIFPAKSGSSSCKGYTGVFHLKSNQILPCASVSIILNFGMRSFSTPATPVFIWYDISPAAMRSISILIEGYNLPSTAITKGRRLTTPSFSGAITSIPTPLALSASSGIGPITPGYRYTHGDQSAPTAATPLVTPELLSSIVGTWPMIVGVFLRVFARALS